MDNKIKVGDKEISYDFKKLTQRELFELDRFYRKIFGECIKLGLMTEKQASRLLEKNGAWGKEQESEISRLALRLNDMSQRLGKYNEFSDEANKIVSEMISDRGKLTALIGEKIELFRQTAEGTAGQERTFLFIKLSAVDQDGNLLFKTNEDIESYSFENSEDFAKILTAAYLTQQGIDKDKEFTHDWAEVAFIERASKNEIDKKSEKEIETSE